MTRLFRATAILAASVLAVSTSAGLAQAAPASSELGQLPAELGSTVKIGQGGDHGFIDTSGSLIGEPTLGSLGGPASQVIGSVTEVTGSSMTNPQPGTGSIDTSGSLLGEPTTGSLAPVAGSVAGAVGSDGGTGSVGPIVLVGGVAAVIALGVTFAPQIEQALADAGIQLLPLP